MSEWKQKRFWKEANVVPAEGGFTVQLDGRAVKTPATAPLIMPTRAMADAAAKEWNAQEGHIDPRTMPVTRSANAAIDKVIPQQTEVVDLIAAYGESDLLCYRAETPAELVTRQSEGWDPLLAWADAALGAPLLVTAGIIHQEQPAQSVARLHALVHDQTPFALAALHDLVALSGSLVIGLAALHGHAGAEALWQISRIDETWQIEQWGPDEEAAALTETKRQDFLHAMRFFALTQDSA